MRRFWLIEAMSAVAVVVLISGSISAHVITPAREAARRSCCRHSISFPVHTGCTFHDGIPFNGALIDKTGRVTQAWSCPDHSSSNAPIHFLNSNGEQIDEADLPFETVFEARKKLLGYRSTPEYLARSSRHKPPN